MKNLIRKDLKISLNVTGILVLLITIIGCIPTLILSGENLASKSNATIIKCYMLNCIMFFPAMQIPMIGTLLFQSVLNEERKQHIIPILLANGIKQQQIWLSKILVTIIISYMSSLISVIIGLFYTKIVYDTWLNFDLYYSLYIFVGIPMIAFAFLNIIGLIMWASKRGQFFSGFIPLISYIACMYVSLLEVKLNFYYKKILVLIAMVLVSLIVFVICLCIVNAISKEYIVNIEE